MGKGQAEDIEDTLYANPAEDIRTIYIKINLNELWQQLQDADIKVKEEHIMNLIKEEVVVINSLRRKETYKVSVAKKDGKISNIEEIIEENERSVEALRKRLEPVFAKELKKYDFGGISFDYHNGKMINLTSKIKKKLD